MSETDHSASRSQFGLVDLGMLGAVLAWGLNFVVVKYALVEMEPLTFNSLRFLLASGFMALTTYFWEGDLHVEREDIRRFLITGIVGNTIYQILFIYGLNYTTAGNSSLLVATNPIFVALISGLLRLEKISKGMWVGIILSFIGMVIVIANGPSGLSLGSETLRGDILTLFAGLCWAVYAVLARPLTKRYSSLKVSTFCMLAGTPGLLLAGIPSLINQDWAGISWQGWGGLVYSFLFSISLAYIAYTKAIGTLGNARTGIYSNLVPVVAMVAAALFLGDAINLWQVAGAIVILTGVYLTRSGGKAQ
jgi:drug/metabolite transporter (DMT)-like permease